MIKGLGGVGKTELAFEYAKRYADRYTAILWTVADNREKLRSGFAAIAAALGLDKSMPQHELLAAIRRWLDSNTNWLILCDNADRPELLDEWLPRKHAGHVILTSRTRTTHRPASHLDLGSFQPPETLTFWVRRTGRPIQEPRELEAATCLGDELGHLPLALEQAGAYITEVDTSFTDYLAGYAAFRQDRLAHHRPRSGQYDETVATTWEMNFQAVEQVRGAREVLYASAFVSAVNIPIELFSRGGSELDARAFWRLNKFPNNPLTWDEITHPLARFSLIRREPGEQSFSIHRLTQDVIRDRMFEDDRRFWTIRVIRCVATAFPPPNFMEFDLYEKLAPHALRLLDWIDSVKLCVEELDALISAAARYLSVYSMADELYDRVLNLSARHLASQPSRRLKLLEAAALYAYWEARADTVRRYFQVFALRKVISKGHRLSSLERALGYLRIADFCFYEGRLRQARRLYTIILHFLPLPPFVPPDLRATVLTNSGFVDLELGAYELARAKLEEALRVRQTIQPLDEKQVALATVNRDRVGSGLLFAEASPPWDTATTDWMEAAHLPDQIDFWIRHLEASAYGLRLGNQISAARGMRRRAEKLRRDCPDDLNGSAVKRPGGPGAKGGGEHPRGDQHQGSDSKTVKIVDMLAQRDTSERNRNMVGHRMARAFQYFKLEPKEE